MKRSEVKEVMGEKSYGMDLSELYKVTFLKDFGGFKSGESTCVTLPIALKWIKSKVVSKTEEIEKAIKGKETEELIEMKDKQKKEKTDIV